MSPPRTGAPGPTAHAAPVPLAEDVVDARVAGGALYTWSTPSGPADGHRIARVDPRTGSALAEIVLGRLVGWAVADGGVVVVERRAGELHCHTLGRDLGVDGSTALPTPYRPFLTAVGPVVWAVLRSPDTRLADGTSGEVGALAAQAFRPGTGPAIPDTVHPLGPAAYWYSDAARRFLDPALASSAPPSAFGDDRSVAIVVGRPPGPGGSRQVVHLLGHTGDVTPLAERRAGWAHQVAAVAGRWLLATAAGLETCADLRRGTDRRLLLPRHPAGASRWVVAGGRAYGVAVDRVSPGARLSLHLLGEGGLRELGRWPVPVGSPVAVRPDDATRTRTDGDHLLLAAGDGTGESLLVRADPTGARVVATAPGWLEPVGRAGGVLVARHLPGVPPGDGTGEPGRLVRVPG